MPRDLRLPKRTDAETEALARVTDDDVLHAEQTAEQDGTPALRQLLDAGEDDRTDRPDPDEA